jgi:hypothetical protein
MGDDVNQHKRRCPRLGHDLTFEYCRSADGELPCRRVFDCWWEIFDVEGWARSNLTEEQIARLTEPPKPKAVSLFELIEQARQRTQDDTRD